MLTLPAEARRGQGEADLSEFSAIGVYIEVPSQPGALHRGALFLEWGREVEKDALDDSE